MLYGGYGIDDDSYGARQLYGGDGDDELIASMYGDNEMFGGDGEDIILAGLLSGGNVTKANLPNLPRELKFINESSKRQDYGSYGNMDIDGGAGNDFIIGSVQSDDIFGGAGNDIIYGS